MSDKNLITATINRAILTFLLLFTSNFAFAVGDDDFITTWNTSDNAITLPISHIKPASFTVTVDWGDGMTQTITTANPTHTYTGTGIAATHSVRVSGTFDRFNPTSGAKVMAVTQWGTTVWRTMESAFQGSNNLNIPTTAGAPDLSSVTSMRIIFNASNAQGGTFNSDISHWDVSNIRSMESAFHNATSFNQDISSWNVSAVTNMNNMFTGANAFNQNLGKWYIVPSATSIINIGGQSLNISAQNNALRNQNPTYGLSGTDANNFNLANGVLTLTTPATSTASYEVIITSTGAFGTSNQITLTLLALTTPTISISANTITATAGIAITPTTITLATGGAVAYSISPTIDNGLSFNTNTGVISGTPTAATMAILYTITATNTAGSDTATVTITVVADTDNGSGVGGGGVGGGGVSNDGVSNDGGSGGCVLTANTTNTTFDPMFYLLLGLIFIGLMRSVAGNRLQVSGISKR